MVIILYIGAGDFYQTGQSLVLITELNIIEQQEKLPDVFNF